MLLLTLVVLVSVAWAAMRQDGEPVRLTLAPTSQLAGTGGYLPSRIEVLLASAGAGRGAEPRPAATRTAAEAIARIASGQAELWMGRLGPTAPTLPAGVRAQRLDWSSSRMAIMRTGTDIHAWSDLHDRTVCVAADGRHTGRLAHDFGAREQLYPAAANALVALRTGQCDAAVADASLLQQLLTYPEWRKFSAQLLPRAEEPLVALWPAGLTTAQQRELRRLISKSALQQARRTLVRSIAFEVYLAQEAPDCHS